MIGGVPDHGLVVGNDHRHALDLMQPHQVDRGQPQAADLAGEPGVGDPRDDAVVASGQSPGPAASDQVRRPTLSLSGLLTRGSRREGEQRPWISGRGISLFNGLRGNFRAIVTAKPG